jgi:hypothetical protein
MHLGMNLPRDQGLGDELADTLLDLAGARRKRIGHGSISLGFLVRPVDPSPNPLSQGERAYAVSFARGFLEEVVENPPLPRRERAG